VSHPTEDELVDVAVGDDARDASISAHVEACEACAATVAELRRTASLVASGPPYAAWQAPADSVWDRISNELAADDLTNEITAVDRTDELSNENTADDRTDDLTGEPADDVAHAPGDLPGPPAPMAPMAAPWAPATRHMEDAGSTAPAQGAAVPATPHTGDELSARRARADARTSRERRARGRAVGWGAGLAAASLAIGLLAGRAIWQPDTPVQPVAQVALSTLDTKQDEGKATVVRSSDGLDLTVATTRPLDAGDGYLEVWLLNADGKRMVSVGVLAPGDKASFPISQTLIDEGYVIVDISREKFDGSPAHSGDSLLRGKLPA
jgi:hypothetical protein